MTDDIYEKPTHLDAIREAWREFKWGAREAAECLGPEEAEYGGPGLPTPIAWLCAPWGPLAYRLKPYNLERLFRPRKAERRQRLADLNEWAFVWGGADLADEDWAEVEALLAEFGGKIGVDFPPRDWEPMSAAETVGAIMGYSREEVAEIVAR